MKNNPIYSDSERKTPDFEKVKQKDSNFTFTFV